jgi:hypothetical protein
VGIFVCVPSFLIHSSTRYVAIFLNPLVLAVKFFFPIYFRARENDEKSALQSKLRRKRKEGNKKDF